MATVFATAGFAAVSGASTATAAVFSHVAIPGMLKNGYNTRLTAGVIAAAGTLASLIPPSAILVVYAIIVEQSVGHLLLAGFLPGLVSAFIYAALIIVMCKWKPDLGKRFTGFTWKEKFQSPPGTFPILLSLALILAPFSLAPQHLPRPEPWVQWWYSVYISCVPDEKRRWVS